MKAKINAWQMKTAWRNSWHQAAKVKESAAWLAKASMSMLSAIN